MNKFLSKYKWHIAPFVIFVASIVISLCILNNDPNKILLSLSILGVGFTIFQFWVSELNTKRRRDYNLKYQAYIELNNAIQNITDNYIIGMNQKENIDVQLLDSNIAMQVNRTFQILGSNINFLFKGIMKNKDYYEINIILNSILEVTSTYRNSIDKYTPDNEKNNGKYLDRRIWFEAMAKNLIELYNCQNRFCSLLESKLY